MEIVVQLPGLIPAPQIVRLVVHHIMEEHVVRDEDLVHAPPGLETVEVVLGGFALDVAGFICQVHTGWVDALAAGLEYLGDGVLYQPVDLEVGMQAAQLAGDGDVALGMPESDGRGNVECAFGAVPGPPPGHCGRGCWLDEVVQQQVDLHRVTTFRTVPSPHDGY